MNSILQKEKKCFICHSTYELEEHHIFHGYANRRLSERYGCKCWLCHHHHTGAAGVHFNKDFDDFLKREAQERFESVYPNLNFREIFGKNYL